jgi:hypothetical protein
MSFVPLTDRAIANLRKPIGSGLIKNANRKIFSIKSEQISRVTTFSGCADQGLRPLIPSQLPKANHPQNHQVGKK